jgi:hypothetical protein
MYLLNLLYFVCLSVSVSYMYSFSEIFRPIRNKISYVPFVRVPLQCPECSSFWFGLLVSFIYNPIHLDFIVPLLTNIFCGLVTHLFTAFLYKKKEKNTVNFIN